MVLLAMVVPIVAHADDDKLRGEPSPSVLSCTQSTPTDAWKTKADFCGQNAECSRLANEACAKTTTVGAPSAGTAVATANWQAAFVSGLGSTIADRAKAEVEAWFEGLVRDKLCELKVTISGTQQLWFPATCKLLKDEMGVGQQIATDLVAEAMKKDFDGLVEKVSAYLDTKLAKHPEVRVVLELAPAAAYVSYELARGRSPLLIVRDLAGREDVKQACAKRSNHQQLTAPCALVFAGLAVDYYGGVVKLLKDGKPDAELVKQLMIKVFAAQEFKCAVIKAFGEAECPVGTAANLPPVVAKFLSITAVTDEATFNKWFVVYDDMVDIDQYLTSIDTGTPPSSDLVRERVAILLGKLDKLLTDSDSLFWVTPPTEATALHLLLQSAVDVANKDYAAGVLALVDLAKLYETDLPEWAARLMPLVVDLAEAKSSEDVSAAISRAAAPIGSWKLKRQKSLISVTALVGGAVGYERPRTSGVEHDQAINGGVAAGVMAPVGIEFSHPLCGWSAGLLISVLDVGQVTWSRLAPEKKSSEEAGTDAAPDANLAQVFSPGAYLVFGVGKTPFTFGAGASYAPALRGYVYDVGGTEVNKDLPVWRFGLFAAVDVTLFPF
jgi:hypothetical protein